MTDFEKPILTAVILICFALILTWHKTHHPIWWYSCVTLLIIACLWDVARTGKPVCDCKRETIKTMYNSDGYLTKVDTVDSLRNELALRDTLSWSGDNGRIEP